MKIRLLEFVKQAGISTTDHGRGPFIDGDVSLGDLERFAELIVSECADLFEVEWGEGKLTGNDVGYVVKKHFGVER